MKKSHLVLAYVVCAIVWGTTWYAIRQCIGGSNNLQTFPALAMRFILASALLWGIVLLLRKPQWPRGFRHWCGLLFAGVLNAGSYIFVYVAEEVVTGSVAAVVFSTEPLVLALALWAFSLERVSKIQLASLLVAFAGVGLLFHHSLSVSGEQAGALGMLMVAVLHSTGYALMLRTVVGGVHPLISSAAFLTGTAMVTVIAALVDGSPWLGQGEGPRALWSLVYLAVLGTVIAKTLFVILVRHAPLLTISTLVFVIPIVAVVVDLALEPETSIGVIQGVGMSIILASVIVNALSSARSRPGRVSRANRPH